MGNLWLLVLCLLLAKTHGGIMFSDHIAKYLNHSIDPCDDFFEHVCSATPAKQNFRKTSNRRLDEKLIPLRSKEMQAFLEENKAMMNEHSEEILTNLLRFDGLFKYVETEEFQKTQKEFKQMFIFLKNIVVKEFEETPWTSRYPKSLEMLRKAELISYEQPSFNLTQEVPELLQKFSICVEHSNITEKRDCIAHETRLVEEKISKLSDFYTLLFDVHYALVGRYNVTVEVFPSFYTIDYEDYNYVIGSLLMLFGHELGHSFFFVKTKDWPAPAEPSNTKCFKKQTADSCTLFYPKIDRFEHEQHCVFNVMGTTFNEDAADWIAMKSVAIVAKEMARHSPDEAHDIWKRVFYAHAIRRCTKITYDSYQHSAPKVRVNAVFRVFPEFAETFNCKKGDRMVKEDPCDPLTGAGAPLT